MLRVIKAATLEDMIDAFENKIDDLSATASTDIKSTTWIDVDGNFGGERGAKYTDQEIRDYWDQEHDSDPVLQEYSSFEEWWEDTKEWLQEDVQGCGVMGSEKVCGADDEDYYSIDEAYEDESLLDVENDASAELGIYMDFSSVRGDSGTIFIFSDPDQENDADMWFGDEDAELAAIDFAEYAEGVEENVLQYDQSEWLDRYKAYIQTYID